MKIAFIGQKGIPTISGGVEKYVENLTTDLVNLDQEVLVYNRYDYLSSKLQEFNGVKIINVFYLKGKNFANITQTFLSIIDVLFRSVDVVHFQGIGPSLLIWLPKLLSPRLKIVATLHSFDYYNDKWGGFAKKMLSRGERLMCKYADKVIVLTADMQKYVLEKYQRETILIPNCTNLYYTDDKKESLINGLTPNDYFVSVSRLIRLKGLQYLIPAFRNLKTTKKLVIVGDGEYLEELKKLAEDDKRIIFVGNQTGKVLDQLYAQAYLFIQSSELEGLSGSLLEAMAHHTACLISDIPANKEVLNGAGFTFKNKDVSDLEIKLQYTLDNPEELNVKADQAYQRIQDKFSCLDQTKKILKIYKELVNRKEDEKIEMNNKVDVDDSVDMDNK